jgi:amidohydrolase
MNYKELAEKTESYIIEQRRWCHQHPELSWEEFNTTEHIAAELQKMGYTVQRFEDKPGCCALLKGGKAAADSKVVALRADIDALPVEEKTGLPFASENKGVMHACGHDCHISMLLGAAKMLMDTKDELEGTVKLIFQSAEETCHGSEYYVAQGILDGVDAIMGQHIWGTLDEPYMNFEPGPRMASCDNFTIKVEGVSAHGTQPNLGVDAIVASAAIIMNLQTFVSRVNDPLNSLVVTVGEMQAGQRFNIIPNHAEMKGTVRTFDPAFRMNIEAGMRKIIENTAAAMGATATLEYEYYPSPVINDDDELNVIAHDAAISLYGEESLVNFPKAMGSEDFAYFADKIPAVFGFLGSRNKELGLTASNHNDHYTVHETVLKRGAAMYAQFAFDYLTKSKK